MTRAAGLARRVEQLVGSAVASTSPVAGGDVCIATRLRLSNGTSALAKTHAHPPPGFFASEADGLRRLREVARSHGGVPTPDVLAVADDVLVLAWVDPGRPSEEAAAGFGRALAATHACLPTPGAAASFGADHDGWIATLPLARAAASTWAAHYAEGRLLPYLRVARERGAIEPEDAAAVEAVVPRLAELVPEEPPSLLHGDLWNGNVLWGADGRAHVVDPASYAGHRETDLAMLALFGLPHLAVVLRAYEEVAPLAEGWQERVGVHQLFPLLVHACLFGRGYGARAADVARRFT